MSETMLCFYGVVVLIAVFSTVILTKIDSLKIEIKHTYSKQHDEQIRLKAILDYNNAMHKALDNAKHGIIGHKTFDDVAEQLRRGVSINDIS